MVKHGGQSDKRLKSYDHVVLSAVCWGRIYV
jgi:hypothetical protein